jgi:acetyl esterase/lipase
VSSASQGFQAPPQHVKHQKGKSRIMLKDKRWLYPILCALLLNALVLASIFADMSDSATWAATLARSYRITPNITYLTANNWEAKLDVYQPTNASAPTPTLIYIHGGGWTVGDRQGAFFNTMPYIEMGWAVVNVSYRLARISVASGSR